MPQQHQMEEGKKNSEALLCFASSFLLSYASLGRHGIRNKEEEMPAVSKLVLLGENTESNLVFKKESEAMYFDKIR